MKCTRIELAPLISKEVLKHLPDIHRLIYHIADTQFKKVCKIDINSYYLDTLSYDLDNLDTLILETANSIKNILVDRGMIISIDDTAWDDTIYLEVSNEIYLLYITHALATYDLKDVSILFNIRRTTPAERGL